MTQSNNNVFDVVVEQLISEGPDAMRPVLTALLNEAMKIEREQFLGASHYERSEDRQGFANGYQNKRVDTQAGTLNLSIPKTAKHIDEPFYPQSLERGLRSQRAMMQTVAEMYVTGVSTRRVEKVIQSMGIENISSMQVSRANKAMDEALKAWRDRPLGKISYMILDARYEKVREGHQVIDMAVLSAVGVMTDGRRSVLGVAVALNEADVNWRAFLKGLVSRGLHGLEYVVSDDHAGLKAARKAVFPGVPWQRCQFHLAQNAIHHAPNHKIKQRIGGELRHIWNAPDLKTAQANLNALVSKYQDKYTALAQWLESNVPEGFNVFALPERHQKKMRTSNSIERTVQQELKRRTRLVRAEPVNDNETQMG
ncbi:MAG: IS256 family transposase [Gammaproteobacteria bacterium]|nr:IS256 family transposase [Gammaproteobacteria bacterium]